MALAYSLNSERHLYVLLASLIEKYTETNKSVHTPTVEEGKSLINFCLLLSAEFPVKTQIMVSISISYFLLFFIFNAEKSYTHLFLITLGFVLSL